jgi:meso-butanediol dehydrogenase / (S,S)-butanediol dehydrogenase / diacetyl reductase
LSGSVQGKSVVVTGVGRGIGAEMARDLARNGANICVTDLNATAAQSVAKPNGASFWAVVQDLTILRVSQPSSHQRPRTM